jgi:HAD superfamily hydrolase (TIGR01509 family)
MRIRAVLFDLDGTLVDSERESSLAMARVLERDHGLPVSQEDRDYVVGHSWNEIYDHLRARHGAALRWSQEELIRRSSAEREVVIGEQGMRIMPGAREAVRRLGARFAKAIVTGSSRSEALKALRVLGAVEEFPVLLASEDYEHGKPDPSGYLAAAARLAVEPPACLVLEDSRPGIAAGRAAGMKVVAVRAGNFLGQDQTAAHRIVETLDHVTDALIAELEAAAS